MRKTFLIISLLYLTLTDSFLLAEEVIELEYTSKQHTFYSDEEIELHWSKAQNVWTTADEYLLTLNYAGRRVVKTVMEVKENELKAKLRYPALREGLVIYVTVEITAFSKGKVLEGRCRKKIRMYSKKWLEGQERTLKQLGLMIWDRSENKGLSGYLEAQGLPFKAVDTFVTTKNTWTLCVALDFENSEGLFETLLKSVNKGANILVVAPKSGRFVLPKQIEDFKWTMGKIEDLSILLNTGGLNKLHLKGINDMPAIEIGESEKGHSYLELTGKRGRLLLITTTASSEDNKHPGLAEFILNTIKKKE